LGVFASVLLHVALVATVFVSFSRKIDIPIDNIPVVPVDLVTVGEKTNIAPMVAPEPVEPPKPEMLEPAPQPDVQAPKFEIAPEAKPKPAPPKEASKEEQLAEALKRLATRPPVDAKTGTRTFKGVGDQSDMTADLVTVLASEIYRCWSPPIVSPHPERLVVFYNVHLSRDGSVSEAVLTPESDSASKRDPYMKAATEAAGRAISACAPYRLPPDRYREWRDFTFRFNPADVIGQ
jgi:hypothetical protein